MQETRLAHLFDKYFSDLATPDEQKEFFILAEQQKNETEMQQLMETHWNDFNPADNPFDAHTKRRLLENVYQVQDEREHNILPHRRKIWTRIAVAASILLVSGIGFYTYRINHPSLPVNESISSSDFKPGSNKAILTLASGKQIILTGAKNGQLATEAGTAINKTEDGEVIYDGSQTTKEKIVYNTMTTPRGGQYHLTLADGTIAWLNSASSITYPVAFSGRERRVEISGEVYFEVAHNAAKPFRVASNGQMVEVLGTHFNINAYANEAGTQTTLLEGAVKISAESEMKTLKPGQQANVNGNRISLKQVDVDEAVAWKDGYFDFTDTDIQTVMRQFSRWYDVDIQFEGPITKDTFTGRLPKSWSLSQVMKAVQKSNSVHLTVQGRRIMIKQ